MAEDYSDKLIKEYKYWSIYIHHNQGYLGRCIIWCKREDALDLADASIEEQRELFLVMRDLREVIKNVFRPDWFNYAFLGNETRHLHGHFVPRYEKPKVFNGMVFKDRLFGHNFKTDTNFKTSDELLGAVKERLKEIL